MKLTLIFSIVFFYFSASSQNIQQIDLALLKNEYLDAINMCNTYLESNKKDASILYRKSLALRHVYKYQQAITNICKAIELDASNKQYFIEYGRILLLNNERDSALSTFKFIFRNIDSTDISTNILLAKIYEKDKKWKEAELMFSILSKTDDSNTFFRYKQALALTKQKKGKNAIPLLEKNLSINPKHINSRHLLFKIYRALEKIDIALIHMDTIKMLDSLNPAWYIKSGQLHATRNHNYLALPQYKKAIQLGSQDSETMIATGNCLYKIKKYDQALKYLMCNGDKETDANVLLMIASSFLNTEKNDSAKLYFKRAYKKALPNAFLAQNIINGLAKIDIANEHYADAIEKYETAILMYKGSKYESHVQMQNIRSIAEIYENKLQNAAKALEIYKKELAQVSEYNNPYLFKYYKEKVEKLNEQVFFEK